MLRFFIFDIQFSTKRSSRLIHFCIACSQVSWSSYKHDTDKTICFLALVRSSTHPLSGALTIFSFHASVISTFSSRFLKVLFWYEETGVMRDPFRISFSIFSSLCLSLCSPLYSTSFPSLSWRLSELLSSSPSSDSF